VALVGRTNAGKSTFLNTLMESKISIVSEKPQTTRRRILGIRTTPMGQAIFFDSPGIHVPRSRLNERMMKDVHAALADTDLILHFMDLSQCREDPFVFDMLRATRKPLILVLSKADLVGRLSILPLISKLKDQCPWEEIVPISSVRNENIELLEGLIFKHLPPGIPIFPEEEVTSQTERFYLGELIREQILNLTRDELPFTTSVRVEEMADHGATRYIRAQIYVEHQNQRRILIGRQGQLLKTIGTGARQEMEAYYGGRKVFLELFIKVVPDWRNSEFLLGDVLDNS